jgi:hypothetical protein
MEIFINSELKVLMDKNKNMVYRCEKELFNTLISKYKLARIGEIQSISYVEGYFINTCRGSSRTIYKNGIAIHTKSEECYLACECDYSEYKELQPYLKEFLPDVPILDETVKDMIKMGTSNVQNTLSLIILLCIFLFGTLPALLFGK